MIQESETSYSAILAGRHCLCNARDSIAMGYNGYIKDGAEGSVLIGDDLLCISPDCVAIGTHYCGEEIPPDVQQALRDNPKAVHWLMQKVREAITRR